MSAAAGAGQLPPTAPFVGALAPSARGRLAAVSEALNPRLPRSVWLLEAGMLANSVGTGLLMPFILIYLHDARGFSLGTAGLIMGTFGFAGIAATGLSGSLVDRVGSRAIFVGALLLLAAAYGGFPLMRSPWQGFLLMAAAGLGNGAMWPSQSTLILATTPTERRHAAFAVNRMAVNLGIGTGAVVGGLVAKTGDPSTFTILFLANAATFVLFALSAFAIAAPRPSTRRALSGSYRQVARDRSFATLIVLNALFVAAGYAQLEAGLPLFVKDRIGLSEAAIGTLFLANVLAVVIAQLPVSRLLEGRRRMRALALMGVLWAGAWAVVALAGEWTTAFTATLVLCLAAVIFAVGECLHGPVTAAVAADLAPEHLRGRYMALSTGSFAIGFALGPAAAGLLLGLSTSALFPIAALVCLGGAGGALLLERRLPEAVRLTPAG